MKKLLTIPAVTAVLVAATAPVAGAQTTWDTGTLGPAEEPTWVIPLVVAFVVLNIVLAVLSARRGRAERLR